jgi:hypothetical protein
MGRPNDEQQRPGPVLRRGAEPREGLYDLEDATIVR